MIQVPPELLQPLFDERLQRGMVFRLKDYPLPAGKKDKYFVVLNIDGTDRLIHHALTTSRVTRWQKLSFSRFGLLVPAGRLKTFSMDTIVDCFSLQAPLEREFLFAEYCLGNLVAAEQLPSDLMMAVDTLLKDSPRIPKGDKDKILPAA